MIVHQCATMYIYVSMSLSFLIGIYERVLLENESFFRNNHGVELEFPHRYENICYPATTSTPMLPRKKHMLFASDTEVEVASGTVTACELRPRTL